MFWGKTEGSKFFQTSLINFLCRTKCEIIEETTAHQKIETALNQTPISSGWEVPRLLDGDEVAFSEVSPASSPFDVASKLT